MSKKYQVFISSTYTDLIEERKAVEETIIRAGDIPVGMEAFPAADDEQFEFIKTVIDNCDYYVLITAGRYGSVAEDGLSYTEKEFRYAVEKEVPILFFPHDDIGSIAADKSENDAESKGKLEAFIALASIKRIRKSWRNADALKLAVREALEHAKATKPRPGWVRGDSVLSPDVANEMVALRMENSELRANVPVSSSIIMPNDFEENKNFNCNIKYYVSKPSSYGGSQSRQQNKLLVLASDDVFAFVGPNMRGNLIHSSLRNKIAIFALGGVANKILKPSSVEIDESDFHDILLHWEAMGLIETARLKTTTGRNADFSKLTEQGLKRVFELRITVA